MPKMVACRSLFSPRRCAIFFPFVILCFSLLLGRAATQQPRTDPTEVSALNTILGNWGKKASSTWNISGEPCTGQAIDNTDIDNDPNFNPGIKCDCNYNNKSICHITKLRVYDLDVIGTIPDVLQNLTYLDFLKLDQNYLTGPLPAFIGNLTNLEFLSVRANALSGSIPKELGNLQKLTVLGMSTNNFRGSIPPRFGKLTSLEQWYMDSSGLSGELPFTLSSLKNMRILWASDNNFTGRIPDYIATWTNLTTLRFHGNSFQGPIPSSLSGLTKLTELQIGDIENGISSSLAFISNMTSLSTLVLRNCNISATLPSDFSLYKNLQELDLSFNNITGQIPQSLFSLSLLTNLFLGDNSLSGILPTEKSTSLLNIDLSYNLLSGSFPSWIGQKGLLLNLVANNFVVDDSNSSTLPSGLKCLQRSIPCNRGSPIYSSFAINCGGSKTITASDNTAYEADYASLGPASYYVTDPIKWGVSSVGSFIGFPYNTYILKTLSQSQNTLNPELFQTSRLSPSSVRYYGLGLANGNYTIKLQFAETAILDPQGWKSLGRRVFDIYVQGDLKAKDFDIKKEANDRSITAVVKDFTVPVTNNFLEIHLFWAGKGTCCIPFEGYYGASISAISVTADFIPAVSTQGLASNSKNNRTGAIAGISAGVVLGLLAMFGILVLRRLRRRRRLREQDEVLTGLDVKPYMFSYAELRTATEDFNPSNILGKGGFGQVFKGKLADGRTAAVKLLLTSSHQGMAQFLAEIATISAVQHRNLVKLYGCCVEEEKRILVYEYLENKSLDQAIFGKSHLRLDWVQRFDILLGVARGLCYLHEQSRIRIVHRDVKASNILLDADLNPKISDFGLARLYDDKMTHINTGVAGTIGYLAPEYAMRGHLTEKADVFSFGVLSLEIVSGRPNSDRCLSQDKVYLLDWAWTLHEKECEMEMVDPDLTSFDEEEINRVIGVALMCTQAPLVQRPAMSRVVAMLLGDAQVTAVTTRPSYLTNWQKKDGSSSSSSSFTGSSSEASNPILGTKDIPPSHSHESSIIEEGT